MARIIKGDIIAGVLGERQALKGYVGHMPARISQPGDVLHMLNMGGVIGQCSSANSDFGQPLRVRVLGVGRVERRARQHRAERRALAENAARIGARLSCCRAPA